MSQTAKSSTHSAPPRSEYQLAIVHPHWLLASVKKIHRYRLSLAHRWDIPGPPGTPHSPNPEHNLLGHIRERVIWLGLTDISGPLLLATPSIRVHQHLLERSGRSNRTAVISSPTLWLLHVLIGSAGR
jgi:hypothetical protein